MAADFRYSFTNSLEESQDTVHEVPAPATVVGRKPAYPPSGERCHGA